MVVAELEHIHSHHGKQLADSVLFSHAVNVDALGHVIAAGTAAVSVEDCWFGPQNCQLLEPRVDSASSTDWHRQHLVDVAPWET